MENIYWKIEILTGSFPAQTESFKDEKMRVEIISLYEKLADIYFIRITKLKTIRALSNSTYQVDRIAEYVTRFYEEQNKKISLVFTKNNKLKFDVIIDKNELTIKVPIDEMFF